MIIILAAQISPIVPESKQENTYTYSGMHAIIALYSPATAQLYNICTIPLAHSMGKGVTR